jgi:hypothetical protein
MLANGRSARAAALCCLLIAQAVNYAWAHVDWTRANDIDPQCLALFHITSSSVTPGETIQTAAGLPTSQSLLIETPIGLPPTTVSGTPDPVLDPLAIRFRSQVRCQSTATLANLAGDMTLEMWFRWDPLLTSASLQFGFRSGARLLITRDTTSPSLDRFGISATHGDFVSAPGFTDWAVLGSEEAGLGDWIHAAVTIDSAGMHLDPSLAHDVYSTGTVARFWLNGHAAGSFPHTVDLTGSRVHDSSRLVLECLAGDGIEADEATIWTKDWSTAGTVSAPFSDGRGSGTVSSSVSDWELYR